MRLVLASNSPRRGQLIALTGWDFSCVSASFDESRLPVEDSQTYVLRLAQGKAQAGRSAMSAALPPDTLIIGADTAVIVDGDILGKPADADEAEAMLRRLHGRSHQVLTGLAVLRVGDGLIAADVCSTTVTMREYGDDEIRAYIATGDPFDKAGAYAIQHRRFDPVADVVGCHANVAGLPVCRLVRLIDGLGFSAPLRPSLACNEIVGDCPIYKQLII
jgi:septum formation protein